MSIRACAGVIARQKTIAAQARALIDYHGHFSNGGRDIKYSIEPYPSCCGRHASGFSTVQDQEHFVSHEREAVTDADLNA